MTLFFDPTTVCCERPPLRCLAGDGLLSPKPRNGAERSRRRGLAPLEMVLSLPILLLVMALMVNFGTVACWKVRALGVARQRVWGNRWARSTANLPLPTFWPNADQPGFAEASRVPELNGPKLNLLDPGGIVAPTNEILDPTVGLLKGSAHMDREFPLLRKLGPYDLNAATELLGDTWEFQRMGLPNNEYYRIPLVYTLPPAPDTAMFAAAYNAARRTILNMLAGSKALWPLDRDEEFIYYYWIGFGPWTAGFPSSPAGILQPGPANRPRASVRRRPAPAARADRSHRGAAAARRVWPGVWPSGLSRSINT